MADPQVLLASMRKRPGVITGRDISDSGPRPFRHRAAADTALAALIETGEIIEVSSRPRAFRVFHAAEVVSPGGQQFPQDVAKQARDATAPERRSDDLSDLLGSAVGRHCAAGRSEAAALILAAADVRDGLRRDPHHAPEPNAYGRCQHCDSHIDGEYAELLHGVRVHVGCVLRYRNAVDRQMDEIIVAALEQSR